MTSCLTNELSGGKQDAGRLAHPSHPERSGTELTFVSPPDVVAARLIESQDFIGHANPVAAERLVRRLVERGDRLSKFPGMGNCVPELSEAGIRGIVEGRYRLVPGTNAMPSVHRRWACTMTTLKVVRTTRNRVPDPLEGVWVCAVAFALSARRVSVA